MATNRSFLLAANLRDPLGKFFAENWTQFPAEYSYMLAFLIVFVVGSVAFSILIQGFYKRQELFANATIVDVSAALTQSSLPSITAVTTAASSMSR